MPGNIERKTEGKNIIYRLPFYDVYAQFIDNHYVLRYQGNNAACASIFGVVDGNQEEEADRRVKEKAEILFKDIR
jgi:hypothetical protein